MRRRRGVTLIELMIAVTLLSLLSAGILTALRVGLNALDKSNAKLMSNRRAVSAQRILSSQIAGLIPVSGLVSAAPGEPPMPFAFFEGQPQTMRFVSSYSLQEAGRGYPRILEYQVIPGEKGRGVRLIVNELLYTGPASAGAVSEGLVTDPVTGMQLVRFRPVQAGPASFVLADRLSYCRFLYREAPSPPESRERWVPSWTLPGWPVALRLEMAPLEPDPTRILPMTLTAPIRAVRRTDVEYTD